MTDMAVQDAIVYEIYIAATPERVFEALVNADQVPQWWGGQGAGQAYRCTEFTTDLRVGGKWRCVGVDGSGREFNVTGEYLEVNPPNLLVSLWKASWTGEAETTVRWELTAAGKGTQVRIRHSGFADRPEIATAYRGWPNMLSWLAAFLEKGETVSSRMP
jgi:uncharacterized protein YndB with AHSA1/START domain